MLQFDKFSRILSFSSINFFESQLESVDLAPLLSLDLFYHVYLGRKVDNFATTTKQQDENISG